MGQLNNSGVMVAGEIYEDYNGEPWKVIKVALEYDDVIDYDESGIAADAWNDKLENKIDPDEDFDYFAAAESEEYGVAVWMCQFGNDTLGGV